MVSCPLLFPPVNTGIPRRRSAAIFPRRGYGVPPEDTASGGFFISVIEKL